MNHTFKAPDEAVLEGIKVTLRNFEKRLSDLEVQVRQLDGVGGGFSKELPRGYDYKNDLRPPTPRQLKTFRDLFANIKNLAEFPPKEMPKGHVWLAIWLHYHPEVESEVDPQVIEAIRSVIGMNTSW